MGREGSSRRMERYMDRAFDAVVDMLYGLNIFLELWVEVVVFLDDGPWSVVTKLLVDRVNDVPVDGSSRQPELDIISSITSQHSF